jgi:hypothetical protein
MSGAILILLLYAFMAWTETLTFTFLAAINTGTVDWFLLSECDYRMEQTFGYPI